MAARFWVGGNGTWDATTTANWSATSGGAGGASVPGAADNVTIDTASTVTTNYNVTITGLAITAAGATLSLGGTLSTGSGSVSIQGGTFTTNNFAVTAGFLTTNGAVTRAINLGSSTVTLSGTSAITLVATGLTFNAGTSQINISATGTITTGGQTFYNLAFTFTSASNLIFTGAFVANNLSVTGPAAAGFTSVIFDSTVTINGTLSTTGTAGNRRIAFQPANSPLTYNLVINSAPSLTDVDFANTQVTGTAAPITGTRIGNLRGNSGITFPAAKTVYWNLAGAQVWTANGWAATSGGTPSTDNFPLAQDTAVFDNTGSVTGTISITATYPYVGTVDMSARTTPMTLSTVAVSIYGDWKNGSGGTITGAVNMTFAGRGTQTITSAGKTFTQAIVINSPGGTVQLADAFTNNSTSGITISEGAFTTNGYAVSTTVLGASGAGIKTINLGASTVTLSASTAISFTGATNLTVNPGTSQINCTSTNNPTVDGGPGVTFYNLSFSASIVWSIGLYRKITGANTFNNLSFTASFNQTSIPQIIFGANQTITGTLTVGAGVTTGISRMFFVSDTIGTQRTLTCSAVSGMTDIDFRDIVIAGAVAPLTGTRLGNCGGNSGITFDSAKTVYWNSVTGGNWGSSSWALSSGGATSTTNFPLAQDTVIFNPTGLNTATTITVDASYNIGTIDMSAMTTNTMTLNAFTVTVAPIVYGSWTFGTGVSFTGTQLAFGGRATQTITSAGKSFASTTITINLIGGTVQLADALSASALTLLSGTFNAVSYNVTVATFTASGLSATAVLRMGSGTWSVTGTGTVWNITNPALVLNSGTSNIAMTAVGTTAKTFAGGGYSYGKLTLGGATGIATFTITGANQFAELASVKTVAHTIVFPSNTTTTIGKWSITGTTGNLVTLSPSIAATPYTLSIAGATTSAIDFLSISYCTLSATSPAEFYVGANSTNTAGNTNVTFTATPSARTLFWVGGTGNWSDTAHWSTTSGGASGAAIPTSLDSVTFNSASNATAYTVTVDTAQARCAALTIGAPTAGALTFTGTGGLAIAGNTSVAASNVTWSYTGALTLTGAASYTFTTNGIQTATAVEINGVGSTWTLGTALNLFTSKITVTNGTFNTSGYAVTAGGLVSSNSNSRTINLYASTLTIIGITPISVSSAGSTNLTFNAGTSTITSTQTTMQIDAAGLAFYNVTNTATGSSTFSITGAGNTFNNITLSGITSSANLRSVIVYGNQTINGTLTISAGADATARTFVQSDTIGTARTLTCNAVAALTDVDFRDITIAGVAVSGGNLTGTRLGNCRGNTGITFGAGTNRYWNLAAGGNWGGAVGWATTSGGTPAINNFPLAQDTAIFQSTGLNSGATVTVNNSYNIGTIDMSARTTNTMTLDTGTTSPTIYGNWINGTGTTVTGTISMTFAGRASQTITSAGKTFTQPLVINNPSNSVTLQDSLVNSAAFTGAITVTQGTFDANGFAVTISDAAGGLSSSNSNTRTIAVGSGTWTIAGTGGWTVAGTGLTVTGTGTVCMSSASAKTFAGGGVSYSGITLDQGGAGALTVTGNNSFANITNSYGLTGATSIVLGSTTQTVSNFSASGTNGNLLTVSGTSAVAPAALFYSGGGNLGMDYIVPTFVRVYNPPSIWYAGSHSVNGGSYGYTFTNVPSGFILMFI